MNEPLAADSDGRAEPARPDIADAADLEFIEEAYACLLGRPVDPFGFCHYLERLRAGLPREQLRAELASSLEAQKLARAAPPARAPTLEAPQPGTLDDLEALPGDVEFIRASTQLLTGTGPTHRQLIAGLRELEGGILRREVLVRLRQNGLQVGHVALLLEDVHRLDLSPSQLMQAVSASLSLMLACAPETFVFLAYRRLLNRDPDPGGRATYLGLMQAGFSRTQVLRDILASEEARTRGAEMAELDASAMDAR